MYMNDGNEEICGDLVEGTAGSADRLLRHKRLPHRILL